MGDITRPFGGKIAVITGGGSGIGRATSLAFARRGATVIVCDIDLDAARHTAEQAGKLGPAAHARKVDVSDGTAMRTLAAEVASAFGVPGILMNNAGVGHHGTFLATTEDEWRRVLDVNLWGVIHGCRAFGAAVLRRRALVPVTVEAKATRLLSRLAPGLLRAAARINVG